MAQASLLVMLVAAVPGLAGWLEGVRVERAVLASAADVTSATAGAAEGASRVVPLSAPRAVAVAAVVPPRAPTAAHVAELDHPIPVEDSGWMVRALWRSPAPARGPPPR